MPKEIQNPGNAAALVAALGLKGKFGLTLDEVVAPTVSALQLDGTPYQDPVPCVGQHRQGAVALNFSIVLIRPGANVLLGIEALEILNENAATVEFELRWLTQDQIPVVTINNTTQMFNVNAPQISAVNAPRVSSLISRAQHTAQIGNHMASYRLAQDEMVRVNFPRGIFLYGTDPFGIGGFSIWSDAVNLVTSVNAYCTEYRAKG